VAGAVALTGLVETRSLVLDPVIDKAVDESFELYRYGIGFVPDERSTSGARLVQPGQV
jgi:hypothetical protein